MEDEIEILLQDLREAQATIARLRQRLSTREMFGSDAEDSESDTDEDKDPWFAQCGVAGKLYQTPLIPTFASKHAMSSQNEWNELEARANRQRARLRLQQRQVRRRIEAQESAAVAAGEEPVLALTQAELAMLSRRYATPSTGEDPAARRRRLANRRRAQRRLESRAAARRLDTDGGVAESALQPPMDGMSTDDAQLQSRQVQDRSVHYQPTWPVRQPLPIRTSSLQRRF
ncbi:hypothetical protein GQ600_22825 [Phytophthora cactorum]|nr:hypothetical protein GQ600_22825 [Phytophthora cactorum]